LGLYGGGAPPPPTAFSGGSGSCAGQSYQDYAGDRYDQTRRWQASQDADARAWQAV